jgi:multicomponent Na+:H+ antiporter subunit F
MMTDTLFLAVACQAATIMLLAAIVMLLWRMAKGPTAADRVIAMDLMSVLVVAFLIVLSIYTGKTTYLDVAIAYACIAFLGTIALARFIHRRGRNNALRPPLSAPDSKKGGSDD